MALENKPDSDLTMINKDQPEIREESFQELWNRGKSIGTHGPEVATTQKQAEANLQSAQQQELYQSGLSDMAIDPGLDADRLLGEDINQTRARNQSNWVKGAKAIGGGLYQGSLIFLEQLGYVADLDTYTNMFSDVKDLEGNNWSNLMKEWQEAGRESDMFKIYEDAPDENSILSQIFKFQSLEGAISSAVGFGLAGLTAAGTVSKLGSLGQFKRIAALTDSTMGAVAGKNMAGATQAFVGPLASSLMSNYYMGQMMAVDTYRASLDALAPKLESGEMEAIEAQRLAAENAQDVVGLNMALVATSYLKFGNIFKRANKYNGWVKNPSSMAHLKEMVVKGSPTAFVENVYQEMIQMEQIHETKVSQGLESEYSDSLSSRIANLALSNRALHAGALGVVGGPIQFALIQKPFMRKKFAAQRELYKKQEEVRTIHDTLKAENYKSFQEQADLIHKAMVDGRHEDVLLVEDLGIYEEIGKFARAGVLDVLKKDIEDIRDKTDPENIPENWDENYQETAQNILDKIDTAAAYLSKYSKYENSDVLVFNAMAQERVVQEFIEATSKRVEIGEQLKTQINNELRANNLDTIGMEDFGANFRPKRLASRFEGLTDKQKLDLKRAELSVDTMIDRALADSGLYEDYISYRDRAKDFTKLHSKLKEQAVFLKSDKEQQRLKNKNSQTVEDADTAIAEMEQESRETQDKVVQEKESLTFKMVKNAAPQETADARAERLSKWDKSIDTTNKTLIKDDTFTSIDDEGNARVFTRHDIVRSHDGRYFRVVSQAGAKKANGRLNEPTMPFLYEIDPDTKKPIDGVEARVFKLGENTFLRDEVMQANYRKGGTVWYNDVWAPYVSTDRVLKPSNHAHQNSRATYAEIGLAVSVNNKEFITNKPKNGEPLQRNPEFEDYHLELVNEPLLEPYEVTIRSRSEGDGRHYLDVYKEVDGKEVKLTRLDRDFNLNYKAITDAVLKSPSNEIKATVTSHYSSADNIVRLTDADGRKKYNPISNLSSIPKMYLPNGKVFFAKTKGKYAKDPKNIFVSMDGEHKYENSLPVEMPDGKVVPMELDFSKLRGGDTYAVLLAPRGKLVPITLKTLTLAETPSARNNGTMDMDIIEDVTTAIKSVFKEELKNLEDKKNEIQNSLMRDNRVSASEVTRRTRKELNSMISTEEKMKEFQDEMSGIYEVVRKIVKYNRTRLTNGDSEITVQEVYNRVTRKNEEVKIRDANFFELTAEFDSNLNLVPALKIRDEARPHRWKIINYTDNYEQMMMRIGGRMRQLSIEQMWDNTPDAIRTGGIETDINLSKPFAGSSLTLQLVGDDIIDAGIAEAKTKRSYYNIGKADLAQTKVTQENIDDYVEILDNILDGDEYADLDIHNISNDTIEDMIDEAKNFFIDQPIHNSPVVAEELFKILESEKVPDKYSEFFNDTLDKLTKDAQIVQDNVETVARIVTMVEAMRKGILAGDIKLINKSIKKAVEPKAVLNQVEGIIFSPGDTVYSITYGVKAYITSRKGDKYHLKTATNPARKLVVYPKDVVNFFGDYAKLHQWKKELLKLEGAQYDRRLTQIKSLEAKLTKVEPKINDETAADSDATEITQSSRIVESLKSLELPGERFDYATYVQTLDIETNREAEIATSLEELVDLVDGYETADYKTEDGERVATAKPDSVVNRVIKHEEIVGIKKRLLNAIPYTKDQISELLKIGKQFRDKFEPADAAWLRAENDLATLRAIDGYITHLTDSLDSSDPISFTEDTFRSKRSTFTKTFILPSEKFPIPGENMVEPMTVENFQLGFLVPFSADIRRAIGFEAEINSKLFKKATKKATTPKTITTKSKPDKVDTKAGTGINVNTVTKPATPQAPPATALPEGTTIETIQEDKKAALSQLETVSPDGYLMGRPTQKSAIGGVKEYLFDVVALNDTLDMTYANEEFQVTYLGESFAIKGTIQDVGDSMIVDLDLNKLIEGYFAIEEKAVQNTAKPTAPKSPPGNPQSDGQMFNIPSKKYEGSEVLNYLSDSLRDSITYAIDRTNIYGDKLDELYMIVETFQESSATQAELDSMVIEYLNNTSAGWNRSTKSDDGVPPGYKDDKIPFKRGEAVTLSKEEFDYEVRQAKAMLPQVPLEVVSNVTEMVNKFGYTAIGAFDKGVRYLVQNAESGTAYHETFHAVAKLYLRPYEKQKILEEYGQKEWTYEFEERLANEFAEYAKGKLNNNIIDKAVSAVKKFFNGLISWYKGTRTPEFTESIFEKAVTGGYANSNDLNYLGNLENEIGKFTNINEFKSTLTQEENVTLQKLVESKKIKIVC